MVQFLSSFFLLDSFNFCWVFQRFPFFVSPCIIHLTKKKNVSVYKNAARGYITNWGTIIGFRGYKMDKFIPLKSP